MKYLLDKFFIKQPKVRRFVTWLIEGDKELDVKMLGANFRLHSIKEHGYLRASRLITKSSLLEDEVPVLLDLASLFGDGDTFVDVGANVGVFSLSLARLRPLLERVRFYAFEANPDTFKRLKVGTDKLGIVAQNFAISDRNGTLDFVSGAVSHVFTTTDNDIGYSILSEKVTVPCRRLDELEIKGDSLLIKIDVEGQELQVLRGAQKLFEDKRVKVVYLDGYKEREVEIFLNNYGFTLLDGRSLEPVSEGVFSLLAVKK